ncbi:MAG: DUF2326 domain-containing protein [Candidatus Electrothrix sp. GM3_4]|nr:DUF2326 domain-containing protein [Candidatus Electrothrix sp. GM3_4]
MFLKSLTITRGDGSVIRNIPFHSGLNLIVDETPIGSGKETGNNVGKTTVLKLIDFCLGAKAKGIYTDPENKRNEYKLVKDFLVENKVMVSLLLKEDLSQEASREVLIERNFLLRKEKIQRIDGQDKKNDEFEEGLTDLLFSGYYGKKPTFRQIIAHNIRHKDLSINNTLKNIDPYARDDEYETLYLFLFGCDFEQGDTKQALRAQIDIEEKFRKRLESEQTKSGYEAALNLIQTDIDELERQKASLNLNPNFESDLEKLNKIKYQINLASSEIGRIELRKDLILEAQKEMQASKSHIDLQQLQQLYQQVTSLVNGLQKTFEDLYEFHNRMVESKIEFVAKDLPEIDAKLAIKREHLNRLLAKEKELSRVVIKSDSFHVLEQLIVDLNTKYQKKGDYENTLRQLNSVESKLDELNNDLIKIDDELFSDEFALKIKDQLNKFNKYFSSVSNELYNEKYALKVDTKIVKGRRLYEFTAFNLNFSSGKKQGEISCFDIAYTLFADEENIPCMHFLLNDKKELMHGNQLIKIAKLVNTKGIQFVASILKDKLPEELNRDEYVILKLSENDKLFRIES